MPKLKNIWILATAPGASVKEECAVNVTQDGLFTLRLPESMAETAQALSDKRAAHWSAWPDVKVEHAHGAWRVTARDLRVLENFCNYVAQQFLKCEVVRTRVIRYQHCTDVRFWLTDNGEIEGNGHSFQSILRGGSWWKPKHDRSVPYRSPFDESQELHHIGLSVWTGYKVEYKRASGTKVEFERTPEKEHSESSYNLAFLGRGDPSKMHEEIPYSDQAADFFANIVRGLCSMALKMDAFFADQKGVVKAITSTQPIKITFG